MNFILSNARETEVESKGKTFRLAAVVLDDWCLWIKQEEPQRAKEGAESFLVRTGS